jgi:hypothetical protein
VSSDPYWTQPEDIFTLWCSFQCDKVTRYIAVDEKKPSRLVVYNLISVADATQRSIQPSKIVETVEKRVCALLSDSYDDLKAKDRGRKETAPYLMTGFMTPTRENEEEFNRWYKEEHLGDMAKVPGYQRVRRFVRYCCPLKLEAFS